MDIKLKKVVPHASISDNASSTFFETKLTTKNDEIRSFMVLPGNNFFNIKFYDHPDGSTSQPNQKFRYDKSSFHKICHTLEGGLAGKVSYISFWEDSHEEMSTKWRNYVFGNNPTTDLSIWTEWIPTVSGRSGGIGLDKIYSFFEWTELPSQIQSDWAVLGWTQQTWDENNESNFPTSYSKRFSALSRTEKEAAKRLGYTASYWNQTF